MDNAEDEYEDEEVEEEMVVFANFEEGTVDKEIFQSPDFKFKIIGLDSETPIVQLGDHTFKGAWNDTIGTKVIFDEDPSPQQIDPVFAVLPPQMLRYKCMCTKTLELSRIFVKPKSSAQKNNSEKHVSSIINNLDSEGDNLEVSHLIQSTINPSLDTHEIMNTIVAETVMEMEQ